MNPLPTIRNWLIMDLGWKLFSLLLALAIWLTVSRILAPGAAASGTGTLTYGNLPVSLISTTTDVRAYRLLQTTVSVTVSGSSEVIGTLQANQIHALVNLADTSNVNNTKQRVEVSVPAGVTVLSIRPESIGVIAPPPQN